MGDFSFLLGRDKATRCDVCTKVRGRGAAVRIPLLFGPLVMLFSGVLFHQDDIPNQD
jgi:hypothetical protein